MGDVEDLMEMGKKLSMNSLEQKKYKIHLDKIRYNTEKAKAWRRMNLLWQLVFFGSLFLIAFSTLFEQLADVNVISDKLGEDIVKFINNYFYLLFGFLIPFSFPLMMWTGVVRGKWEGKVTRSVAYALSFMENIEHRTFLEEEAKVRPLAQVKTPANG
jgi:hypothetical protein